mmetsp:Transcript_4609/g.12950  ORF Transcript_4609/g.12950 Transcript_4609/m.12950 type:complete len:116 (-) Transcript_4609:709-1056(-)
MFTIPLNKDGLKRRDLDWKFIICNVWLWLEGYGLLVPGQETIQKSGMLIRYTFMILCMTNGSQKTGFQKGEGEVELRQCITREKYTFLMAIAVVTVLMPQLLVGLINTIFWKIVG